MTSTWKPIVVGVDETPASTDAVVAAWTIASQAGVACRLVHATPEPWPVPTAPHHFAFTPADLDRFTMEGARSRIEAAMRDRVPDPALRTLDVRIGRPPVVIRHAAAELDAELVVVGGKHHSVLGRWVGGSTAHALSRTLDVPMLVTAGATSHIKRVMAAVDLSDAARTVINQAERYAGLFNAQLDVVHLVEPAPVGTEIPLTLYETESYERSREHCEQYVWPLVTYPQAETSILRGLAAPTLAREIQQRGVDLLVVGSHGKGWVDRILLGSTTERLLHTLPATVLVIPVVGPTSSRRRRSAGRKPKKRTANR